jgi:hypothetical protein
MKAVQFTGLFAGISAAHSAVWKVTADGNEYVCVVHNVFLSSNHPILLVTRLATFVLTTSLAQSVLNGSLPTLLTSHGTP